MINDILRTNVGLEGVLDLPLDNHLPDAKDLPRNLSSDIKVEDLYKGNMFNLRIESAFGFKLDNQALIQPSTMRHAIEDIQEKLQNIRDEDVASFIKNDLQPLLQNTDLFNSYMNMMVNG